MRKCSKFCWLVIIFCIVLLCYGCSSSIDCKQCNAKIESDAAFCSKCGEPVNHVHDFSLKITEAAYLKEEASCSSPANFYYSCECGEKGSDTFSYGETTPHSFEEVAKPEYIKSEATCMSPAVYFYSCKCGEKNTDTFTSGETVFHSFSEKIVSDEYLYSEATHESGAKYFYACSMCKISGSGTFVHGEPLEAVWGYNYYIDNQFGDKTDDWYVTTHKPIEGSFENSATDGADLLVEILYDCNDEISIFLYEYADEDNLVKNNSSQYKDYYKIAVKNENGKTYEARGQMHPGEDRIFIIDTYHDSVLELMKTSEVLKFYIQSEDSPTTQYRFELIMDNFNDAVADMQSK